MSNSETSVSDVIEVNDDVFFEMHGHTKYTDKENIESTLEGILDSLADAPPEKKYALSIELQEKTVLTEEKLENTSYQELRKLASLDKQHPTKRELIDAVLEEHETI
jgi:hypothetical protein